MVKEPTEKQVAEKALGAIGAHVLRGLGQPADLQRVQVRHLWGTCYRVNVFAGADLVSAKVIHSYFVVANETGAVVDSRPPLVRAYSPPEPGA
ncbi:hypothetical protein AYO40_03610 [Planctomycetaceae bacterium SCGC AG-212-D15]|nr:hypothetical protein AYO40_03610 [Planctomycetaceae bacterium SCGC AG-212-D15]